MDGYLQSTIAANSMQQNQYSNRSNNNNNQPNNKLKYSFPDTNKDFHCTEFQTEEGTYTLLSETFIDTIAPRYQTGTKASVVSLKGDFHSSSSFTAESSDDEGFLSFGSGSGFGGASFTMTPVKSAALPIPTKEAKSTIRTTSSASSIGRNVKMNGGLQILTSPQKTMTTTASGNNSSPYFPNSPVTTPTYQQPQQQQASASYMMSSSQDFYFSPQMENSFSSSFSNNNISSSVNSLSSLFSKSYITSSSITKSSSMAKSYSNTKPKNHLAKTTSQFVHKFLVHENLQKILADKSLENEFIFFNLGHSFFWIDYKNTPKEPLSRIVFFQSFPLCHDVNETTRCEDHIDIIIGFSTGDIVWYEPLSCKYVRMNKAGAMVASEVMKIQWIPGSEDLFVALFKNGTVLIMDKERDDQAFTMSTPSTLAESEFMSFRPHRSSKYNPVYAWKLGDKALTDVCFSPDNQHMAITGVDGKLRVIDYRNERLLDVYSAYFGKLFCVDWSPDGNYILTGGEDDLVTLWSFHDKRMIARCQGHKSYVTSVAFDRFYKPDDGETCRFGSVGEDCNLCLWNFTYSALVKPKHAPRVITSSPKHNVDTVEEPSPVSMIPPAPVNIERKKSSRANRILRPFSSPDNTAQPNTNNYNNSFSSSNNSSFSRFRKKSLRSQNNIFPNNSANDFTYDMVVEHSLPVIHPPLKQAQAAILEPVIIQEVHPDPCVSLTFKETMLITSDRRGKISIWKRP